jgi:hypothetical protein
MADVTLTLPPDTERKLRDKAGAAGMTLEDYLRRLAESDVSNGAPRPATFDEVVAPVRRAFLESGMTDAELADLVEEARDEVWRERTARKTP